MRLRVAIVLVLASCLSQTTPDTAVPIVSTVPPQNATGVRPDTEITVTTGHALDGKTVTTKTFLVTQNDSNVAGTVSAADNTATFTPAAELQPNAKIAVTLTTGIHYSDGTPLPVQQQFSFSTGSALDHTPPTVVSTVPAAGATAVPTGNAITATFSEAVTGVNGTTFTLATHGGAAVAGTASASGATATFTPSAPLTQNTQYDATLTTGVTDASGNALAAPFTWSFTTAATAFTVSAKAASWTTVALSFSSVPNQAQATAAGNYCIGLSTDANCSNALAVSGAALSGATVTLTTPLQAGAAYKVFVTGVTRDQDGASLQAATASFDSFNPITNPSFESETGATVTGWKRISTTTSVQLDATTGAIAARTGNNVGQFLANSGSSTNPLTSTSGGREEASNCFALPAGAATLNVSGWVRTAQAANRTQVAFGIYWFTDAACTAAAGHASDLQAAQNLAGTDAGWVQNTYSAPVATAATYAYVSLRPNYVSGTGAGTDAVFFDDIAVSAQ